MREVDNHADKSHQFTQERYISHLNQCKTYRCYYHSYGDTNPHKPVFQVHILGQLSPLYIGASNNTVYPVVGWTDTLPDFEIDDREVALLIETPLNALQDPDSVRNEQREIRGRVANVPYFSVRDQIVWGATAMILGELLELPSIKNSR